MAVVSDLPGTQSLPPRKPKLPPEDEPDVARVRDAFVPPVEAPASALTGSERKAAVEAYRKVLAGQQLTSREQILVKRLEKEKEERLRWQYYGAIPQKHWREMSGRQAKVLQEQAIRYSIPFGSATINLPAVARALHDFLADNAHKLNKDVDELLQGAGSPALERYREERALIARLDRLEREGQLLPRETTRAALGRIAALFREAGDALQRQFGPAAVEILYDAIDDAEHEINRVFGADTPQEPVQSDDDLPEQLDDPPEPSDAS